MLTDDELTTALHDAYRDATADLMPSPSLATTLRGRYSAVHRQRIAAAIAIPAVAAAAVSGITLWGRAGSSAPAPQARPQPPARHSSEVPASEPGKIRLAGYIFALPAAFHAQSGTCTATDPDGESHQGTPGADGGCIAIWLTKERPNWIPEEIAAGADADGSLVATLPIPEDTPPIVGAVKRLPASHGGGYVVAALRLAAPPPRSISAGGVSFKFLRQVLDKAINGGG